MTRRGKRDRQPPARKCIFCGRGGLTREHIWPDWAASLLPDAPQSLFIRQVGTVGSVRAPAIAYNRKTQGGVKKHKVQAVCERCNRGWMSQLEEGAKPIIAALIEGRACTLLQTGLQILREWITLKLMVAEHDTRGLAVIPASERIAFEAAREIPAGLFVKLFHCGAGRWRSFYQRHSGTMTGPTPPPPWFDPTEHNAATVALGIGDALFVAFYRRPEVPLKLSSDRQSCIDLLPSTADRATWPPPRRLTDQEAAYVAATFDRLVAGPLVQ